MWTAAAYAQELTEPLANNSRSASGDPQESGRVVSAPHTGLSTIDLVAQTGAVRRGVFDIVDRTMRLALGAPGAARPASLDGAAVYTTQ